MNMKVTYLVQALDNLSPNIIEYNGETLYSTHDEYKRQELASKVSDVSLNGKKETQGSKVRAFYTESEFIIEAITENIDSVDRKVPIVIYASFPQEVSDEWLLNLKQDIKRFIATDEVKLVKLSIDSEVYKSINQVIIDIWKKKRKATALKNLKLIMVLSLMLILLPIEIVKMIQVVESNLLQMFLIGLNNLLILFVTLINSQEIIKMLPKIKL